MTLAPLIACADPAAWMAKTDPVTLPYLAYARTECPVSGSQVSSLVESLLVESGLTPERAWPFPHSLFLRAKVECIEFHPDTFAFVTTIGFGRLHDGRTVFEFYDTGDIGVVSRGNASFILESVEIGVECALSDYLGTNFKSEPASDHSEPQGMPGTGGPGCAASIIRNRGSTP